MAHRMHHRGDSTEGRKQGLRARVSRLRWLVPAVPLFLAMAFTLSLAIGAFKPLGASADTSAASVDDGATTELPTQGEQALDSTSEPVLVLDPVATADEPSAALAAETPTHVDEAVVPVAETVPANPEPSTVELEGGEASAPSTQELSTGASVVEEPQPPAEGPTLRQAAEDSSHLVENRQSEAQERTLRAAEQTTFAVTGDTVDQCNNTGSVGGDTITCTVTITNNCTYNPATPSEPTCQTTVVTEISCTGSAVCPTGGTLILTEPITVVTQCNNAGLGGASTVTCTVTVTNNLTGYPVGSAIDSTVLQCQDPGAVDTLTCTATPPGNDRPGDGGPGGQSVAQCNSSGGPGGTMTCTVTAPPSQSTGLPTTITQCEGSGPTGASTVTCTATITNNFIDSIPADDEGGGGPGGGGPGGGGPGGGGPGGGGPGGGGPGGGGPGGGGPGDGGPGDGPPGTGGGPGSPPGTSTPPGTGTPPGTDTGPPITGGDNRLPFTGFDVGIAALLGMFTVLLGVCLRRVVYGRSSSADHQAEPNERHA